MKLSLLCVGRPRGALSEAIHEYEARIGHYFGFEVVEVKEQPMRGGATVESVVEEEGARLLARVPDGAEIVALDRTGKGWSSEELAAYLQELALRSSPGAGFVIGGAYGLSPAVLKAARHRLSLSSMTLPHEMARLVLAEQLYRAGTIARGEPYHK